MLNNAGNTLISNVFKALSHPTRIHILRLLKDGPLCVCKIIEDLETEQSNTSQHLNVLKNSGLVESKKEGLKVIYSARYPDEIYSMIDLVEKIILKQTTETQSLLQNVI